MGRARKACDGGVDLEIGLLFSLQLAAMSVIKEGDEMSGWTFRTGRDSRSRRQSPVPTEIFLRASLAGWGAVQPLSGQ